jgi:hypothetical protein
MRTSTKQLWFMLINSVIDTHVICAALFYSVQKNNVAIWISAAAVITSLWAFTTIMFTNNNKRKVAENTANGGNANATKSS